MTNVPSPLRLMLNGNALVANWCWLAEQSGAAACGAAIKANGYGLGARGVVDRLIGAGCRDFFVSNWNEVQALGALSDGVGLSVLHGIRSDDMAIAVKSKARPVLNTHEQVLRWRPTGLPCDVMIDTGMNRLGLSVGDVAAGLLEGLKIDVLMSHFACADENSNKNDVQLAVFSAAGSMVDAKRRSIANSAGILLGSETGLDLTRPGLALYGGIPRSEAKAHIAQVVYPQAQIVQRRCVTAGEAIGYGGMFIAPNDIEIAILNVGYADGYLRSFGNIGSAGGGRLDVVGRVSMDLLAISVDAEPNLAEGDWIPIDFDLSSVSAATGISQYELLTGLGQRYDRIWN